MFNELKYESRVMVPGIDALVEKEGLTLQYAQMQNNVKIVTAKKEVHQLNASRIQRFDPLEFVDCFVSSCRIRTFSG